MKTRGYILGPSAIKLFLIAIFGSFVCGCQSPAETLYVSLTRPQTEWGKEVGRARRWHDEVLQEWETTENIAMTHHAQEIADRIVRMASVPIVIPKVTVLKGSEQNAFTIGGGYIYLFEGLMEKAKSDDGIAMVVAHEVGHCTAGHIGEFYWSTLKHRLTSSSQDIRLPRIDISEAASTYKGHTYAEIEMNALEPADAVEFIMTYLTSALSRQQEREADVVGAYYMNRAGYQVEKGINFFFLISQQEAKSRREAAKELEPLYVHLNTTLQDYKATRTRIYQDPVGAAGGTYKVEEEVYLKRWLEARDRYEECIYKWKDALFEVPAWFRSHPPVSERIEYLRQVQTVIKEKGIDETFRDEVKYTLSDLWLIERGLPFPKEKK